jgi:hypothetical protein
MISRIKEQSQMHKVKLILILFLLLLTGIGLILADDYGISWDEPADRKYARGVLSAYSSSERIDWEQYEVQINIGPAYLMFWLSLSDTLGDAVSNWTEFAVGHFLNYLTFILGMFFFYLLSREFFEPLTSIIITCLFLCQPVLFGHAFINQKDIPFMTAFMGAISLGAFFSSHIREFKREEEHVQFSEGIRPRLIRDWKESQAYIKIVYILSLVAFLLVFSFVAVSLLGATSTGDMLLNFLGYQDNPFTSFVHEVLVLLTPANNSIAFEQIGFSHLKPLILILAALLLVVLLTGFRLFSNAIRALWIDYTRGSYLDRMGIKEWIYIIICGALVGIASSIRVLGPFAGLLVLILIILINGFRLPIQTGLLLIVSLIISYTTWPFLWGNMIKRYVEIVRIVARHPWRGVVLFEGAVHSAESLPWYYIPKLLILQLSEPILFLILVGLFFILRSKSFTKTQKAIGLVLILWVVIPISIPILGNAIVYDNFRQFLFALPPLFILAGLGLESIFRKLNLLRWKLVIGVIALLPGIFSIIKLHPYQYMYYNGLAGGIRGAFRDYELDYWGTSYRELFSYANKVLPQGADIAVWGPFLVAETYAREDFNLHEIREDPSQDELEDKYLVLSTRHNTDLRIIAPGKQLFEVEKKGIPLAKLYDLEGD